MLEKGKKIGLTARQLQILELLRKGLTNSEICRALSISENTVKVHLANIYKILDVTNRTEAVAIGHSLKLDEPAKRDVVVMIGHNDDIKNFPLAHNLFLSVVEALQGYRLFQIKLRQMNELDQECSYQVKFSAPVNQQQALFVSLHQADNSAILWSNLQHIQDSGQIKLLASQIAIQIYRSMMLAATSAFAGNHDATPAWWYASSYATIKIENRSKEDFAYCQGILQDALKNEGYKDYVSCTLASIYYTAISENWVDGTEYTKKIGEIACATMRETPTSTNSIFCMALYNILIGNKNEAISYFEAILQVNPLCIMSRRLLAQLYLLAGREDDSLKQLDEYARFVPNSINQPFQFISKAFIYFLQGNYESCEKVSRQVLMFHPEIPFARLFLIACSNRKGDMEESQKQVKIFHEYHPNFTRRDLNRFVDGIAPAQKSVMLEYVKNLFE